MKKMSLFLVAFLFMFIGILTVNATDCQYSFPYGKVSENVNGYIAVMVPNFENFSGTYYICFSLSKINSRCTAQSGTIQTIYRTETGNRIASNIAYKAESSSNSWRNEFNNSCPRMSFYYTTDVTKDYSGVVEFAPNNLINDYTNLIGIPDSNYANLQVDGISSFTEDFNSDSQNKEFEEEKKVIPVELNYKNKYKIYLGKEVSNGKEKKYIQILNLDNSTTKACYLNGKSTEFCKKDNTGFGVLYEEVEDFWNGNFTQYYFSKTDKYYIISTKEDVAANYTGTVTIIDDENNNSNYVDISSTLCDETKNPNVLKTMRFFGYIFIIVKILIPLGLIIVGSINLFNNIISGNYDELTKNIKNFGIKLICAIVIFVLPTIINFSIELIDGATDGVKEYDNCRNCIFEPNNCKF